MIKIKFPDGKIQEFENGVNALQIAQSISPSLAKKCVAAKINGNIIDLTRPINEDADFSVIKDALAKKGEELGVTVSIQHEDIFNAMHRI